MCLGRTHALSAGAAYAALGEFVFHQRPAVLLAGTAIACGAGVLPDMDTVGSTVARSFGAATECIAYGVRAISGGHREGTHTGVGDAVCAGLAVLAIALEGVHFRAWHHELSAGRIVLGAYLAILFGAGMMALRILHRGNGRRYLLAAAAAGAMAWTGFDAGGIAWAILLGTAVHCFGDMLTKHGVAWGRPFTSHVFHLLPERLRLSTGHGAEHVLDLAMTLTLLALAVHEVMLSLPVHALVAAR